MDLQELYREALGRRAAEIFDIFIYANAMEYLNMRERLKSKVTNVDTLSDDEVKSLHIEFFPEYHI